MTALHGSFGSKVFGRELEIERFDRDGYTLIKTFSNVMIRLAEAAIGSDDVDADVTSCRTSLIQRHPRFRRT